MHRHLTGREWALAFGDPDDQHGWQLYGCPRCSAVRGDLEAWILSVAECPLCWPAFEAYQPIPPDALDCETCLAGYEEFEGWLEAAEHFEPMVALEWGGAEAALDDLRKEPFEVWLARLDAEPTLRTFGLCQRLLAESKKLWLRDAHLAHQWAKAGLAVAERLAGEQYHPRWVADLRAKASAYLANTFRILGDLRASELTFARAEHEVESGVGQGRAETLVLNLKATLLLDQHRLLECEAVLDRVERHLREYDQGDELPNVLMKRAMVSAARIQPKQAVKHIEAALELIDETKSPHLHQFALHNLTRYRVELGDAVAARSTLERLVEPKDHLLRIRRWWLTADVLRIEGDLEGAARLYDDVRIAYLAEEMHFNVAVISLDLAIVARMQGDHETVRELARDALVLLTRAGAPQEAFAAIRLLVDAVEHEAVSTAFIRQVARNLARVRPPK